MNLPTRLMTPRDRRFVVPTWAESARYGRFLPRQTATQATYRIIDALLDSGARVLCIATDERTVHAWCAGDGDTLHFVYVAPELRRNGLARHMLREMFGERGPLLASHEAPKRLAPRAQWNPYILAGALAGERKAAAA